jgi:tetratricopeptide (TPR) repeat protein
MNPRPIFLALGALSLFAGFAFAAESPALAAAKTLYHQKHLDEARVAFESLAKSGPEQAEAEYHLGLIALTGDEPKAAVEHFEKAAKLVPDACEYQRLLGDAYGLSAQKAGVFSKLGLAKKCLRAYEKAVEIDPRNLLARWSVMEFCKQAPGIVGGGMDKAHAQAAEIEKIDAGVGRWAKALLLLKEEKVDAAFALYDGVLEADPADYAALCQFGRMADWTGQHLEEGRKALETCLMLEPTAWAVDHKGVHLAIGHIFEKQGNSDAARPAYVAALQLDPGFKPAQEALARLN